MFRKVLVANRGEIACRVLRTCRRLGLGTVAVYSEADEHSPHVGMATEAVCVGPPPVRDSYLNVERILRAIRSTKSDAVHPGYGLLSESRLFAEGVLEAGATFVGPPPDVLQSVGDKIHAREVARAAGVEPLPGSDGAVDPADTDALTRAADRIGYPLLVKAAAGGGGIGMQLVRSAADLPRAVVTCADRAAAAFGDSRVYLESYLTSPRHVEVQIIRDSFGATAVLGERECSVQRRHQKVIEETPSPASFFGGASGARRREKLLRDAAAMAERVGYLNAGTVEFVADDRGNLYFLEVNARLQVEHPVTEMVTGLDLVELQFLVASRVGLPASVERAVPSGHAIEARVYAEDPDRGFVPQPGTIRTLAWPRHEFVRVDAGVAPGDEVTPFYDPLIAKVIAHAGDRRQAILRLDAALASTTLDLVGPRGPRATNLGFLRSVLRHEAFASGSYDTSLAGTVVRGRK